MKMCLNTSCFVIILTLVSILSSCKFNNTKNEETLSDQNQKFLNTEKLQSQTFSIYSDRDTIIKGKSGTVLKIYKNTFVDKDGKTIQGNIQLELKEAFSPSEIIMSGLTTTSNGQFLETGGMIYLNGTSNGQQLEIANSKFIGTIIPSNKIKNGMKLFEGELDSNGINWKNPKQILNDKLKARNSINSVAVPFQSDSAIEPLSGRNKNEIDAILTYVESDTSKPENRKLIRKKNKVAQQKEIAKAEDDIFLNEITYEKGINSFIEDSQSRYIFSLKKLGWANIDRLYEDPRTKQIEFVTNVENQKDFKTVYITLILSNRSIYIPGYQMEDETFSFTHNDSEPVELPIGETATILATAYKGRTAYYGIKTIKISDKQKIEIKLIETTDDKLKEILKKQI